MLHKFRGLVEWQAHTDAIDKEYAVPALSRLVPAVSVLLRRRAADFVHFLLPLGLYGPLADVPVVVPAGELAHWRLRARFPES